MFPFSTLWISIPNIGLGVVKHDRDLVPWEKEYAKSGLSMLESFSMEYTQQAHILVFWAAGSNSL